MSVANFTTVVLLARAVPADDFGVFTLLYSALQFSLGAQSALVTQAHNVIGAAQVPATYRRYSDATSTSQAILALAVAALAGIAAAVAAATGSPWARLLGLLVPCILFLQFQEYTRRVLYTEDRLPAVFANDSVAYGLQALIVAGLWVTGRLSSELVLTVMALTSAAALVVGVRQIRPTLRVEGLRSVAKSNWRFGRWLFAGFLASWLSSDLYLYLIAGVLGAAATGAFKAADLMLRPVNLVFVSLESVLLARFSRRLVRDGIPALKTDVRSAYLVVSPLIVGYCVAVVTLSGPFMRFLYGGRYEGLTTVVALLAIWYLMRFSGQIISIALRSAQRTRPLFEGPLFAAIVSLTLGWVVVTRWGLEGALAGLITTSLIANIPRWRAYASLEAHGG